MPTKTNWTTPWRTPSASRPTTATPCAVCSPLGADALRVVREPLRWYCRLGPRRSPASILPALRRAALGPCETDWAVPDWLLPHQREAARQLAGRLAAFRGALLADAVGLGKTYVALAVATRYPSATAVVPAALRGQWHRVARALGIALPIVSHEVLSRGGSVPPARLLLVDEAHRFRNPRARRVHRLADAAAASDVLLITATPVVNRVADLASLLRLFLPDHGLALLGIPSLAAALGARALEPLAHALSSLIVARSPRALQSVLPPVPRLTDDAVLAPPPLPPGVLAQMEDGMGALRFPTFVDRPAAELLRLHLWYRLASSAPAFVETLRRHATYLERALAAARRGERLSRRAARVLFGADDDCQLELDGLGPSSGAPLDVASLEREAGRIEALRRLARSANGSDPKADALRAILRARPGKTLVFTAAVATAYHLAQWLRWTRLCVATGRGARIASGSLGLEAALGCFAPRARGVRPPPAAVAVDTLIATDLLSEGLDLQDAEAVIHYDLPWTPLRLEQRVGRAARLGSAHGRVAVWWFRPGAPLERHLALARRLREKLAGQLRLGAATSSDLGRARVSGGLFDWRARFGEPGTPLPRAPSCSVVRGGPWAACVLRWSVGPHAVPLLVVLAGIPLAPVANERVAAAIVQRLASAPASEARPPAGVLDAVVRLVRARLADHARGPADEDTRTLARRIVRLAGAAAHRRDATLVGLLDETLDRLVEGVPAGPLRALDALLATRPSRVRLEHWLRRVAPRGAVPAGGELLAALIGDGTLTGRVL